MTISCLFSTIEGRCWPSYVRTASGEGHYWLHASVGKPFCTKRCGLYQDFYLVLWDDPKEMLTWEVGALGHWDGHVLFWGEDDLKWPGWHQSSIVWCWQIHRTQCAYLICIYLSLPPVPYITSLQPRTDYSFVQNGLRCKRCYLGARRMPSNLFGSHTLTLEVGLGGDFVSVFDSKKHYILFDICCFDDSFFFNVWFSLMSHPCWYPSFLYFFCW